MGKLIDTSIFIECERGRLDLDSHLEKRCNDEFFMSVITASELLHGIHRASPKYKIKRSAAVENWISRFTILEIDLSIARRHAKLFADLKSNGLVIGPHDLWLAATCLTYELGIVSANEREFNRVPNLGVENWASA